MAAGLFGVLKPVTMLAHAEPSQPPLARGRAHTTIDACRERTR